jgi:hypothetical protein
MWLPEHRWVAELDGQVVGWTALAPISARPVYAGVAESTIYVAEGLRGGGIGKAPIHKQVTAADAAGLWTLQTAIFPKNRASIPLHRPTDHPRSRPALVVGHPRRRPPPHRPLPAHQALGARRRQRHLPRRHRRRPPRPGPAVHDIDGTRSLPDGRTEQVDTPLLATGYRPDLPYLGASTSTPSHCRFAGAARRVSPSGC